MMDGKDDKISSLKEYIKGLGEEELIEMTKYVIEYKYDLEVAGRRISRLREDMLEILNKLTSIKINATIRNLDFLKDVDEMYGVMSMWLNNLNVIILPEVDIKKKEGIYPEQKIEEDIKDSKDKTDLSYMRSYS